MAQACSYPQDDRVTLGVQDIAKKLAAKDLSSVEVTDAFLKRIEETQPQTNAYARVLDDSARKQAKESDARRAKGEARGPYDGVPISLKECVNIKGEPSTIGLPSRAGHRAMNDGVLAGIAKDAGCVILGQTNISQAMLFNEASNPVYGRTNNPFNVERGPGGSSGGEGAAIGAFASPGGIGTDIGGSIRLPAVYNGGVGLLPTVDRISNRGNTPGIPGQEVIRGQAGPMAHTTDDLLALLEIFSPTKCAARDPRVKPFPVLAPEDVNLKGIRVGLFDEDEVIAPPKSARRALNDARRALENAGATVVGFKPPHARDIPFLYLALMSADGAKTLMEQVDFDHLDPALSTLWRIAKIPAAAKRALSGALKRRDPNLANIFRSVGEKSVADVWKLTTQARTMAGDVFDAWNRSELDAVIAPVHGTVGLPHGMSRDTTLAHSWSFHFNFLGFPAVGIATTTVRDDEQKRPKGRGRVEKLLAQCDAGSAGMPSGIQIAARPYREDVCLALSRVVENAAREAGEFPRLPSA